MFLLLRTLVAFAAVAFAAASPAVQAGCTITSFANVSSVVSSCTAITIQNLTVPAGKQLHLPLKTGATVTFTGKTVFQHSEWNGPLVVIEGSKVTVTGASGALLDGQGAQYWDGQGDGGKVKPKFFSIKTSGGSKLSSLHLLNCPLQCVSINSNDTTLSHFNIDVSAGDKSGGKNTDGFDVSGSTNVVVEHSTVKNQDDCVAVNQGSNLLFHNLTCSGGHGLSLSVGQSTANGAPNTVSNVNFTDSTVQNSRNGIHVKTHTDAGTGSVHKVLYQNIVLSGITHYGVNVQEDYAKGNSTGTPKNNIPITGLTLNKVTGSMDGSSTSMAVYILCATGGCSSWQWSGVSVTHAKQSNNCHTFVPTGFSGC